MRSPAEVYETEFVPALFQQWGHVVVDAAGIRAGQDVLDVACGTGVLACAAAERVGPDGVVVGLDANDDMLAVARRKNDQITWKPGTAEELPFEDGSFDAVVSQFGLMFFGDRSEALREMMRVLRPGGRLAVAVWDSLDRSPGYAALERLLRQLFGDEVAASFCAPFVLGDSAALLTLCDDAGILGATVTRHEGSLRFGSIGSLVSTERACVWTLGGLLDEAQFEQLLSGAERALSEFVTPDGAITFSVPALIVTAAKAK